MGSSIEIKDSAPRWGTRAKQKIMASPRINTRESIKRSERVHHIATGAQVITFPQLWVGASRFSPSNQLRTTLKARWVPFGDQEPPSGLCWLGESGTGSAPVSTRFKNRLNGPFRLEFKDKARPSNLKRHKPPNPDCLG